MSSTHSHGKMIGVIKQADGTPIYVGYEKICSSNTSPRTPEWHCVFAGALREAIEAIFNMASYCEGGMLRGAGGRALKPENYIAGWFRELANPVALANKQVSVNLRPYRNTNSWAVEVLGKIKNQVQKVGTSRAREVLQEIEKGDSLSLHLHTDLDILKSLSNDALSVSSCFPSYLITHGAVPAPELGYAPRKGLDSVDLTRKYLCLGEASRDILCQSHDGHWHSVGWDSQVLGDFIRTLADVELRCPGSYKRHIQAQREALANAPHIGSEGDVLKVRVDLAKVENWQDKANLDSLLEDTDHTINGQIITISFPMAASHYWRLGYIPREASSWIIDGETNPVAQPKQLALVS